MTLCSIEAFLEVGDINIYDDPSLDRLTRFFQLLVCGLDITCK